MPPVEAGRGRRAPICGSRVRAGTALPDAAVRVRQAASQYAKISTRGPAPEAARHGAGTCGKRLLMRRWDWRRDSSPRRCRVQLPAAAPVAGNAVRRVPGWHLKCSAAPYALPYHSGHGMSSSDANCAGCRRSPKLPPRRRELCAASLLTCSGDCAAAQTLYRGNIKRKEKCYARRKENDAR